MTSVDSNFNFLFGRPHGAGYPSPINMRPPEPHPSPSPCGRHKWMAPNGTNIHVYAIWSRTVLVNLLAKGSGEVCFTYSFPSIAPHFPISLFHTSATHQPSHFPFHSYPSTTHDTALFYPSHSTSFSQLFTALLPALSHVLFPSLSLSSYISSPQPT